MCNNILIIQCYCKLFLIKIFLFCFSHRKLLLPKTSLEREDSIANPFQCSIELLMYPSIMISTINIQLKEFDCQSLEDTCILAMSQKRPKIKTISIKMGAF